MEVEEGNGNGREQIGGEWWGSCSAISCPPAARQETSTGGNSGHFCFNFPFGKLESPPFQLQFNTWNMKAFVSQTSAQQGAKQDIKLEVDRWFSPNVITREI